MVGYVRKDTSNEIDNGEFVDATYLDLEFDGIEDAFHASTGHSHDGTTGDGSPILVIGPSQDFVAGVVSLTPKTTATYDLGSGSLKWKDIHLSGAVNTATVVATGAITAASITTTGVGTSSRFKAGTSGTEAIPAIGILSDNNTGFWSSMDGNLSFSSNANLILDMDYNGIVVHTVDLEVRDGTIIGNGSTITDLDADNISSGTINANHLPSDSTAESWFLDLAIATGVHTP